MDIKGLVDLCLSVLKDWHVIFVAVVAVLFMSLASYVVKYRKRPSVPRPAKVAAAKPAPKPAEPEEAAEEEE